MSICTKVGVGVEYIQKMCVHVVTNNSVCNTYIVYSIEDAMALIESMDDMSSRSYLLQDNEYAVFCKYSGNDQWVEWLDTSGKTAIEILNNNPGHITHKLKQYKHIEHEVYTENKVYTEETHVAKEEIEAINNAVENEEEYYNKVVVVKEGRDGNSYTGEYIEEWCIYHIQRTDSKYREQAKELYEKYWGQHTEFKPNPYVYYKAEMKVNFMGVAVYKLLRDENKSPRFVVMTERA